MTTGIYSYKGSAYDATMTVTIKTEPVFLKTLPPQGRGFFTVFTTMFRGRGIHLSSSQENNFGLYSLINDFFTAVSVLYLNPRDNLTLEAAILSPTVQALDCYSENPSHDLNFAKSLLKLPIDKSSSKFRVGKFTDEKNRDLVIHSQQNPEFLKPQELEDFISELKEGYKRLLIGGFYVLVTVPGYKGTDLLLTTISSFLNYVGMVLANNVIPVWIFRLERSPPPDLSDRLTRYPIAIQKVVKEAIAENEVSDITATTTLDIQVTPTSTLDDLFRLLTPKTYREIFNLLSDFQPKYLPVIERAKANKDQKVQMKIIVDLLYDLALSAKRS